MPRCQVYNFQLRIDNLWNSVLFFFLFEFETVPENVISPSFLFICFFFFSLVSFSSYILIVLISILIPIEDIRQEFDEKERHSAIYIVGKVLYF